MRNCRHLPSPLENDPPQGDKDALLTSLSLHTAPFAHWLSPLYPLVQPKISVRALSAEKGFAGFQSGCTHPPLRRIGEVCWLHLLAA